MPIVGEAVSDVVTAALQRDGDDQLDAQRATGRLELLQASQNPSAQNPCTRLPASLSSASSLNWPDDEEAALALAQAPDLSDDGTAVNHPPPWADCVARTFCAFCLPR